MYFFVGTALDAWNPSIETKQAPNLQLSVIYPVAVVPVAFVLVQNQKLIPAFNTKNTKYDMNNSNLRSNNARNTIVHLGLTLC